MNRVLLLIALASFAGVLRSEAGAEPVSFPSVGDRSIGGTVTGGSGPEAGVWVIAETADLASPFVKIVVTDDHGRFVLPDLPKAKYRIWARGYGLVDTKASDAVPGQSIRLIAAAAPTPAAAAQIYPANYWFSLIRVPPESVFPGTGPDGNGVNKDFRTQQDWLAHMKENCQFCHQMGTRITREVTGDQPLAIWDARVQLPRAPDDVFFVGDKTRIGRNFGPRMNKMMTHFGRQRALEMYADWTTRIAEGETPTVHPERPLGIERNVVITLWGFADGRFLHDSISSDKRNPMTGAGGAVYGFAQHSGIVSAIDPKTGEQQQFKLTDMVGEYAKNSNNHTGTMDGKGRLWMSMIGRYSYVASFCSDPENKFARYFPRDVKAGLVAGMFDPKTRSSEMLPVCFGTHHLNFDKDDRLYFSGDSEVVGWIDVKKWDRTKDASKSIGWCPMVLDTNGDGRITPDRSQWNVQLEGLFGGEGVILRAEDSAATGGRPLDPKKDTRIAGFNYGMGISPTDQSYWAAKYSPYVPSGILRVDPGRDPPRTCKTEYWVAPRVQGKPLAFNARSVDVDAQGVAWVSFGTGIGRFDRAKCKASARQTLAGDQCPEGWEIIETPGPKFRGTGVSSDWFYHTFVDHHDTFGLGKGIPIFANSVADELLAYLPDVKRFVHLRVPYPIGFYARGVDGRIDDPTAGWKGRGLWASNNVLPLWHQEGGEGSTEQLAHFQLRPNPLAE
ncbi:MAG: hypothetical protein AB7R89_27460 [Dehalococcoidia bacterium]